MKILIVEDDRAYRTLLFDYLNQRNDVSVVENGVGAIALLTAPEMSFDLVILDIRMPVLDGRKLLESFAQWSTCKTSFLVISGDIDPSIFANIPAVIGCLAKPFHLEELDSILEGVRQGTTKRRPEVTGEVLAG